MITRCLLSYRITIIVVIAFLSAISCNKPNEHVSSEDVQLPADYPQMCYTDDASGISEYSATLNGHLDKKIGNISDAKAWFLWSRNEDTLEWLKYRGDKVEAQIRSDGTFSYELGYLQQSTLYYYATAIFYEGVQYYGEVKSFTTTDVNTNLTYTAEAVDLGLPSGLLWSRYNLGAASEEDYGAYFAWGELEPKNDNLYNIEYYKWCEGTYDSFTKYCAAEEYGTVDNITQLEPEDDVAAVKLGNGWRIPTKAEQDELRAYCTWKWTTRNGVAGCELTSTLNEETLFFPASGAKTGVGGQGSNFTSWSSTQSGGNACFAWVLSGDYMYFSEGGAYRFHGHTVRPVKSSTTE